MSVGNGGVKIMEKNTKKAKLIDAISCYPSFENQQVKFEYYTAENLCIGHFQSSPSNKLPVCSHSHDVYEFVIPYMPLSYMLREEQICFGRVGRVYPIPCGIVHGIKYAQQDISLDSITVDKEFLEEIKKDKRVENLRLENEFLLTDTLRCFISTFKKECRMPRRDENNKLEPLARLITAELIDLSAQVKQPGNISTSIYQQGVRSAADYINDHYTEELTLETLAAICGLSAGYFTKCFTKMFTCSPTAYIAMVRISNAKILLETTMLSVKEIAHNVGYNRSSTFCDAFKRETNMTPNEYRASILGYKEGLRRQ